MAPIRIAKDDALSLVDSNRYSLDEIVIVFSEGPVSPIFSETEQTHFDATWQVIQNLPEMFELWDIPTVVAVYEDSDICPSSVTIASCRESFTLPLFNVGVIQEELQNFFNSVPRMGDDSFPDDNDAQDQLWSGLCLNMRRRALGLLSSYLARTTDGQTPGWFVSDIARIVDDEVEHLHVVFTNQGMDGLSSVTCWDEYWNGLEDHDGPLHRTTWKRNSQLEVFRRDPQRNAIYFKLVDEDGHETFCAPSQSFETIKTFLQDAGWGYSEIHENGATIVGGNNNIGQVYGDINVNSSNQRSAPTSPTPHIQPTQQRPGAAIESGIISGNVNITGLAQINGIVQGDVQVPSGSDVDLKGIIQGTVRVNGGTARIFGTAAAASISSGRIEIYGILQTPLQYSGGDVFYHPNSIVG